jgi:predicted DNA-binding transcriptional regulator AlpA
MAATTLPKELSNQLLKTVPFLKKWASNPSLNAYQVAQTTGIAQSTLYQAVIPEFLNIYHAASKQQDFPSNILTYYNQHGNPEPNYNLTEVSPCTKTGV